MQEIFTPRTFAFVADGTEVCPFLNDADRQQGDQPKPGPLPRALVENVSVAAGRIQPGVWSSVHTHPLVTQITYVTAGELTAKMQAPESPSPYVLRVPRGSAMVTPPGTLLQLGNQTPRAVEVLYIVSPPYVRTAAGDGDSGYDDSVLVAADWNAVSEAHRRRPSPAELDRIRARRLRAREAQSKKTV